MGTAPLVENSFGTFVEPSGNTPGLFSLLATFFNESFPTGLLAAEEGTLSTAVGQFTFNLNTLNDIAVVNTTNNNLEVYLNQGTFNEAGTVSSNAGSFQLSSQGNIQVGNAPVAVGAARLNFHDNGPAPDLVVANNGDTVNPLSYLAGNSDGTFQVIQNSNGTLQAPSLAQPSLNGSTSYVSAPAAIVGTDNTGKGLIFSGMAGLVVICSPFDEIPGQTTNPNPQSYVFLGPGDGTLTKVNVLPVVGTGAALAPLRTGNANLDLVVANGGLFPLGGSTSNPTGSGFVGTVSVLLGNGDGTFGSPTVINVGSSTNGVVVTDVDGDGNPDIVVTDPLGNQVMCMLGNGDGTFQTPQGWAQGKGAYQVAAGVLNQNAGTGFPFQSTGLTDLLVTNILRISGFTNVNGGSYTAVFLQQK
jgi:hypothetical protein